MTETDSQPDNACWLETRVGEWDYEFDACVGRLKRAAIDAYVCSQSLPHRDHFQISGDHYEAKNPRWAWIARPGPDGTGGGYYVVNPNARWQQIDPKPPMCETEADLSRTEMSECRRIQRFDEIRAEIDDIVEPWRKLPDPEEIGVVVDSWRAVFVDMCDRAERPDTGAGSLRPNLGHIKDVLDGHDYLGRHMQSSTIDTFKSYVDNLRVAVDCCQDTALVIGVAIAAEQALWECARKDFCVIISATASAMEKCARAAGKGGDFDISALLSAAGVVVGAVGLFTGPIGSSVATATSIGLTVLGMGTARESGQRKEVAPDYWGLLQKLRLLL
ncbi:MAG: hypothetical protein FWE61_04610, partial [Micrococcales bacterium]|nr:hypothetical protein [Micrococcales bacterium]